ncbi:DUF4138 domain-containing protein [Arenibacter sp. 6A1]|uniref:DUF4138 domain-containing protein n=1 Tax=Arenibacter sp. 6A1 TaxID=2720391 RepID=UPI0014489FB6|nr:DUF4138 domain-containing protein [Arenibacter sp. 6A1]NKI27871.1 DUF4138 domain-containing protein [Arenibacter sp. 6A1]
MRKAWIILLALITGSALSAQAYSDTLQVSKHFKTILIFPENISESSIGNDFGFNVDLPKPEGGKFGGRIVKLYYDEIATENKRTTNYLVITDSGNVYDFILKLVEVPQQTTWYIKKEMAIANISDELVLEEVATGRRIENNDVEIKKEGNGPMEREPSQTKMSVVKDGTTEELYRSNPMEYIRLRCYYMQFDKPKIIRYFSRSGNVFIWLKGVYYNQDELYFQYRIENKEGLDLDINFIKHQIATNYKNSSSNQKMELEPVFTYKQPKRVEAKSENHFIVVFKKFALDERKEVVVELDEEYGNRNISLRIGHEIINNPIQF